jgi:hypothetical protein
MRPSSPTLVIDNALDPAAIPLRTGRLHDIL